VDGSTVYSPDEFGSVIESAEVSFGGQVFEVGLRGVPQADIARLQMAKAVDRYSPDCDGRGAMKWVVGALDSLRAKGYRKASYVSEQAKTSRHNIDPFFLGGCLADSDLEDGMLIYTHRNDGSPIAMLKADYVSKWVAKTHNIPLGKALFVCRHFRVFTTMLDGITHIYLKPVVIGKAKWWVWSSAAAGWFSCFPPPADEVVASLKAGKFDARPTHTVEFIAFSDFLRNTMDIARELRADMGAMLELDPFADEIIVHRVDPSSGVDILDADDYCYADGASVGDDYVDLIPVDEGASLN
jgi:hypothetical protein